jgi:hypothetical protein
MAFRMAGVQRFRSGPAALQPTQLAQRDRSRTLSGRWWRRRAIQPFPDRAFHDTAGDSSQAVARGPPWRERKRALRPISNWQGVCSIQSVMPEALVADSSVQMGRVHALFTRIHLLEQHALTLEAGLSKRSHVGRRSRGHLGPASRRILARCHTASGASPPNSRTWSARQAARSRAWAVQCRLATRAGVARLSGWSSSRSRIRQSTRYSTPRSVRLGSSLDARRAGT